MPRRFLPILLALAATLSAGKPLENPDFSGFLVTERAGFTLLLSPLVQADPALQERLLWRVEEQLREASDLLPPQARPALRQVRVWLDPEPTGMGDLRGSVYYLGLGAAHHTRGNARARVGDIVVKDAARFIASHGSFNIMLHELAHAYDDRAWNFSHPPVLAAYEQARREGRYSAESALGDHYAVTNPAEYFAVLTEAYFASRPATPRNRAELQRFDPAGYEALRAAWGLDSQ